MSEVTSKSKENTKCKGLARGKNRKDNCINVLKIETQNVRGFRQKEEWFTELKRKNRTDILAIQETHINSEFELKKTKR